MCFSEACAHIVPHVSNIWIGFKNAERFICLYVFLRCGVGSFTEARRLSASLCIAYMMVILVAHM